MAARFRQNRVIQKLHAELELAGNRYSEESSMSTFPNPHKITKIAWETSDNHTHMDMGQSSMVLLPNETGKNDHLKILAVYLENRANRKILTC